MFIFIQLRLIKLWQLNDYIGFGPRILQFLQKCIHNPGTEKGYLHSKDFQTTFLYLRQCV